MKRRIAIVGGGISGLTAAYVLHRDHSDTCEFSLFEANRRFGGTIETVHADGFTIECGPDSWVTEKPWAEQLARELNLADELMPSNDRERHTYIARRDAHASTLAPLPDAMRMMVPTDLDAVLSSSLFTDSAKQAYLAEPQRATELRSTALLSRGADDDESVATFVRRHFGDEVTETVAGPLLAGVFGGDVEKLSARALLGPFVTMEREYGSLILGLQATLKHRAQKSTSIFTTLASGLETLVKRLLQSLPSGSLHRSTEVQALQPDSTGWTIETREIQRSFDRVLLATPLDTTRHLLASLPFPEAREAAGLLPTDASSSVIVALGHSAGANPTPTVPPGFGLLVASSIADPSSLLACTFLHRKFQHRAPQGATLLRAFFGNTTADRLMQQSDETIASAAREQLIPLLGPLPEQADVTLVRRWPRSLPQYEVGHLARMTQFATCLSAIPGLAVAGNSFRGVGLPDLIRDATESAHQLACP